VGIVAPAYRGGNSPRERIQRDANSERRGNHDGVPFPRWRPRNALSRLELLNGWLFEIAESRIKTTGLDAVDILKKYQ
jgi:hypothetical protein